MHVFSLANELQQRGHQCAVLVPDSPETVQRHGKASFRILSYDEARHGNALFEDNSPPDLFHVWSPREHVRLITEHMVDVYNANYIVHMEDDEEEIVKDEIPGFSYLELQALPAEIAGSLITPYRSHPHYYREFIKNAVGFTCLIEGLLDYKPDDMPGIVFWPGFDDIFAQSQSGESLQITRDRLGFGRDEILVVYAGNVHSSISADVARLYTAIGILHRRGVPIRLVRTGWNYSAFPPAQQGLQYVTDLGFVPREQMPALVGIGDILLQPGMINNFNKNRFPSKLPEYLVSGRPVILPNANIALALENDQVWKLYDGSIKEMVHAIDQLIANKELRENIGRRGRDFALQNLTWQNAANKIEHLYKEVLGSTPARIKRPTAEISTAKDSDFPVKLVAFYLPQFHPIPENNIWWGEGFTEWTNVVRAPVNYRGHLQPKLPTDLGFYDLRVPETMRAQANIAKNYGVHAFCFYYYWFGGRRLLEKPLDLWLSEQGPDFPFCICWANESWSRRWDGSEDDVLMAQTYNSCDHLRFFDDVIPILKDRRYLRIDGAPVLLVYRVSELRDPVVAARDWRAEARKNGIDRLHLCAVESFGITDPRPFGFDAAIEFPPPHFDRRLVSATGLEGVDPQFCGYMEDYISVAMRSINHPPVDYIRYRGVIPRWDNTPRRRRAGHILINDSTKAYGQWLRFLVNEALARRKQQAPIVFINAWNEWAEGAFLEPDEDYGNAYLKTTYAALKQGIIDHVKGATAETERAFVHAISHLPKS